MTVVWLKGLPPTDDSKWLLKFKTGVVCSGSYRYGGCSDPQPVEKAWRCDCCGTFATPIEHAVYKT